MNHELLSPASQPGPIRRIELNRIVLNLGDIRSKGVVVGVGFTESSESNELKVTLFTQRNGVSPDSLAGMRLIVILEGSLEQSTKPADTT